MKVGKGEVALIACDSSFHTLASLMACAMVGVVAAPISVSVNDLLDEAMPAELLRALLTLAPSLLLTTDSVVSAGVRTLKPSGKVKYKRRIKTFKTRLVANVEEKHKLRVDEILSRMRVEEVSFDIYNTHHTTFGLFGARVGLAP